MYSNIADIFHVFVNLKATREEILHGVKLLKEVYPKDVDLKLTDELLHFHLYVRKTHSEGHSEEEEQSLFFSHKELCQIICKEKNPHFFS